MKRLTFLLLICSPMMFASTYFLFADNGDENENGEGDRPYCTATVKCGGGHGEVSCTGYTSCIAKPYQGIVTCDGITAMCDVSF